MVPPVLHTLSFVRQSLGVSVLCRIKVSNWLQQGVQRRYVASSDNSQTMRMGKDTNLGNLAGAIAERVRTGGVLTLDAVGPKQTHQALKSVIMANGFLKDRGGHEGKQLAVTPEKRFVELEEEEQVAESGPRTMLRLHMQLVPEGSRADQPDIKVAATTNTGWLAGHLTKRLKEADAATLGGMGATSSNNSLKAMLIAQAFLKESLTGGRVLAVSVWDDKVKPKAGKEDASRMMMSCTRVPTPASWTCERVV